MPLPANSARAIKAIMDDQEQAFDLRHKHVGLVLFQNAVAHQAAAQALIEHYARTRRKRIFLRYE